MAFISLSLLIVSVSYLLFRTRATPWSLVGSYFRTLKQSRVRETQDTALHPDGTQSVSDKTTSGESLQRPAIQRDIPEIIANGNQKIPLSPPASGPIPKIDVPNAPKASASQLMPPPPVPKVVPTRSTPQSSSTVRRVPQQGLLPNRGPSSAISNTSTLLAPSTSLGVPANPSKPRRKVILQPGHSPLDWANLTRSSANLSGVPHFLRVSPSQLAHNNGRKGRPAWSLYQGKVYNITPYLPYHPGGEGELMRAAGKSAEKLFMEIHPWVNFENMLGDCVVGFLVVDQ
jgi:cytochrome b involved in lipid metabolism